MYNAKIYIEERYNFRLLISLICATAIAVFTALLLPEEIDRSKHPIIQNIIFEYTELSRYFKNQDSDEGGGGGGGPAPKETSADVKVSVPWLPNLATPIISDKQDSSVVSEIDIPSKDVGQGIGTGEGSGIGTGKGTGIGGGIGNGIGNGIGDGSGAAIIPPRPLVLRIPEYPASESKKQTSVTIQLSIRVNANGEVDSVVVIKNPTGNIAFVNSALQAAYASRYQPAKLKNKAITTWTKCEYQFSQP